jgi:hypothetical protein
MGFAYGGVWVMPVGYCGPMGYGMQLPANQVGRRLELWDIRGYLLSEVWVMRSPTVLTEQFVHSEDILLLCTSAETLVGRCISQVIT